MTARIMFRLAAALALTIGLVLPAVAAEPGYPALSGRVVDQAGILSAAARAHVGAARSA